MCSILIALASACPALGQANFSFRNFGIGLNAPVFDSQGVPLAGTNYLAELWGAAAPDSLKPLVLLENGGARLIKPFWTDGYVIPTGDSALVVPDVPGYGWAWLQMRAWDAKLGPTYEEAEARGLGSYGESPLFYTKGGYAQDQFPEPGPLIGLQSFRLRPGSAVLMRSISRQGDQVVIEWNPGFKRYQLQQTSLLVDPWEDMGQPTTALAITNPIMGGARFYRVVGLSE